MSEKACPISIVFLPHKDGQEFLDKILLDSADSKRLKTMFKLILDYRLLFWGISAPCNCTGN